MKIIDEEQVERWGFVEIELEGKSDGNPFLDYFIKARFRSENEEKTVDGFYDGDGIYRVRFMPSYSGVYQVLISGSFSSREYRGSFTAAEPSEGNHGPVRVANTYHFAYEDGTPHYSVGTTAYVWTHQKEDLRRQTLETLKNSAFNKIRFCVFPKHYDYNFNEPETYPYEGTPCDNSGITKKNFIEYTPDTPGNNWDFTKFNPEHFRLFESQIQELMRLGIEADIIMLHPYDRWGFSKMSADEDNLYFNYIIARFSAFRNVWWSLANEYDLMPAKSLKDWERLGNLISEKDPYRHLRSIHNCHHFYNHSASWITHCSIQRQELNQLSELVDQWREIYRKPVVLDEISYEGNIQHGWGNIGPRELVRRFWEALCRGGYSGHGETYLHPEEILWWSHGGVFHGESPDRLLFMRSVMEDVPGCGLKPRKDSRWAGIAAVPEAVSETDGYFLFYYGIHRPSFREFFFDDERVYRVEVIDTWNMTIEDRGLYKGHFRVEMPGCEYIAIRIIAEE